MKGNSPPYPILYHFQHGGSTPCGQLFLSIEPYIVHNTAENNGCYGEGEVAELAYEFHSACCDGTVRKYTASAPRILIRSANTGASIIGSAVCTTAVATIITTVQFVRDLNTFIILVLLVAYKVPPPS